MYVSLSLCINESFPIATILLFFVVGCGLVPFITEIITLWSFCGSQNKMKVYSANTDKLDLYKTNYVFK